MHTTTACAGGAAIDVTAHLEWATKIAKGIRRFYRFAAGGQEEQDLIAMAHLTLVRVSKSFNLDRVPPGGDPAGQFRGWAHPHLRGEIQREARRLRNGGTYWTRVERGKDRVVVSELPQARCQSGSEILLLARAGENEDEAAEDVQADAVVEVEPAEFGKPRVKVVFQNKPTAGDPGAWKAYLKAKLARAGEKKN